MVFFSWGTMVLAATLLGSGRQQAAPPAAAAPAQEPATAAAGPKGPVDGAAVFQTKGCIYCHGADAGGIVGKGPSLRNVGATRTSAELYRQIHDGGMEMPPFADALTEDELQGVVGYLSHMKLPVAKPAVKRKKR